MRNWEKTLYKRVHKLMGYTKKFHIEINFDKVLFGHRRRNNICLSHYLVQVLFVLGNKEEMKRERGRARENVNRRVP